MRLPHVPRRIAGLDGRLVVGAAALGAAYVAFTRGGGPNMGPLLGGGPKVGHSRCVVNSSTGMLYQSSRPVAPPSAAQGVGEWVAVNCPDHGAPGICWQWDELSTVSLAGIPAA